MSSILGIDLGFKMPSISASSGFGANLTILFIVVLIVILGAFGVWLYFDFKAFNKKIVIFENIAGQGYQPTRKDRARTVKIGDGGEEVLYLRSNKVYRTAYGRKMGKNTYWFAIGQDGYWYNVLLGDLDAKMGMLDIEPIDRDMRYMHVAIRKNITERYRKVGIMEKYGSIIIGGIFLLIMIVAVWFLLDKVGTLMKLSAGVAEEMKVTQQLIQQALGKVDTMCAGGSGIS